MGSKASALILVLFLSIPNVLAATETTRAKTSLDLPKNLARFESIRIAVEMGVPEIKLAVEGPYTVTDALGHTLYRGDKIVGTTVRAASDGIKIGTQTFHDLPVKIASESGIRVDKHVYRRSVKFLRSGEDRLNAVNEIGLEDYLKGVLAWEANPKWSMNVLKAQAIVSRTYALFKAIEKQGQEFELSRDVLSQVYGGKNSEHPVTNQAVDATQGKILTYQGKIFPAYFHSTCGGATTRAEYAWNVDPHPALGGVSCNFCRTSKHYRWEATLTFAEIEKGLKKSGLSITGIRNISIAEKDATDRARWFVVEHSRGKSKIQSNDFRLWVDPARFKSTLITSMEVQGDKIIFKGRGWGHGVGLCQYGAKELSDLGYSPEQILDYYYPGSEITQTRVTGEESPVAAADATSSQGVSHRVWDSVVSFFARD